MSDKTPQSETSIKILTKDDLEKFLDMELDLLLHKNKYKKDEPNVDHEQEITPPVKPDHPLPEDECKKEEPCVDNTPENIPPVPASPLNDPVEKPTPEYTSDNKSPKKADVTVNSISVSVIQN